MANTYKDDAKRGLSKLQKAILVWLLEEYERMNASGRNPREWSIYQGAGVLWADSRKTFYGKPLRLFGGKQHYWYGEAQSVSRALRRLEQRRLVNRWQTVAYEYTWRAELTEQGELVANELRAAGTTSEYLNKRPAALELLYSLARPRCPVCGGLTNKEGHCSTKDCLNVAEC